MARYLAQSEVSIDPFARNFRGATYRNDLNPDTEADWHMDAYDFLLMLRDDMKVKADLAIFDPPYSPTQIKRTYNGIGLKVTETDTQRTHSWSREKDLISDMLTQDGVFLYLGWDTSGMTKRRGFEIVEIMIVHHGPGHNDTLCTASRRLQMRLV